MIKKEKAVKEEKKKPDDDWMTRKWRPMMAIMYMFCCLADFFIFPIMFTVVQFWETAIQNDAFRQWVPITLQGGGLFHVAMGAVLGVSAYGRTQEKLNGATNANTGLQPVSQSVTTTFGQTSPGLGQAGGSYNSPGTNSWGTTPIMGGSGGYQPGYGATPPMGNSFGAPAQVTTGFGGKLAPPMPEYYPER
jgi:hypothetical protein